MTWPWCWATASTATVAGRELLLSAIGVESIRVENYAQLYEEPWGKSGQA